jgi:hypothetical protein
MVKLYSLVTLTTSFGLGVLCQERKEFDCIRVIMVGKTLRALRSLVG